MNHRESEILDRHINDHRNDILDIIHSLKDAREEGDKDLVEIYEILLLKTENTLDELLNLKWELSGE